MKKIWQANAEVIKKTNLNKYIDWLKRNKNLQFESYDELWRWSVEDIESFWLSQLQYHEVKQHKPFSSILRREKVDQLFSKYHWFPGSEINYAEHIFRNKEKSIHHNRPAIISISESDRELGGGANPTAKEIYLSWEELEKRTSQVVKFLKENGVKKNDRVAAIVTNQIPAVVIYLACISLGAVYSSCSPEFGQQTITDRLEVIRPSFLFANLSHSYQGKKFNHEDKIINISTTISSLKKVVLIGSPAEVVSYKKKITAAENGKYEAFSDIEKIRVDTPLEFTALPFDHPMVILFSSGTTGLPKAITHSQGGVLLEHLKYLSFHNDLHEDEVFFWYTSTGWMMWNFLVAALLQGSTIVLYEGAPLYPHDEVLFAWAERLNINHFGCSASYLAYLSKKQVSIKNKFSLPRLRSIGSTGSPLSAESFDWAYENVKEDMWLFSMSGGSDVCTAFVGGCPLEPIYRGEIQRRTLGSKIEIFSPKGESLENEVGELVITKPMPSMPIYLYGDTNYENYRKSYFSKFPNVWQHGDLAKITETNGVVIYGRSDSTLNRSGIRMGTGEIYRIMDGISFIKDSLIIELLNEAGSELILFLVLNGNNKEENISDSDLLDANLIKTIKHKIRSLASPRHVPDKIIAVPDIPYTLSGKKVEVPIKKILQGENASEVVNLGSLKNPQSLDFFINLKI